MAEKEYIERGALLSKVRYICDTYGVPKIICERLKKAMDKCTAADVAEVRHGEWKLCFEDWRQQIDGDECSACGFRHYGSSIRHYNYCPNCGAKMDGETKTAENDYPRDYSYGY